MQAVPLMVGLPTAGPTNLAAPGPWTASLLMIAPLGACSFFGLYCRLCLDYFESSAT